MRSEPLLSTRQREQLQRELVERMAERARVDALFNANSDMAALAKCPNEAVSVEARTIDAPLLSGVTFRPTR